jgi:hypothetical protein
MRVRVCSGFSPTGRLQYGERFLRSFDRYWPRGVELQVWVEEPMPMPRGACRDLWAIPGAREFHERHRDDLRLHGRAPTAIWKDREIAAGYSFRTDAYKFWKQILIPEASSAGLDDGDILVWLDGDVETFAPVPEDLVPSALGSAEVAYLNRDPKHSEIGFWALRINPSTRLFLHHIALQYRTDRFLDLREWHSAFIWDHERRKAGLIERSLCPPGSRGHVWPRTVLARCLRHDKGKRKPNA